MCVSRPGPPANAACGPLALAHTARQPPCSHPSCPRPLFRQGSRTLLVTDPRAFFPLYPAVRASGLRPAHLARPTSLRAVQLDGAAAAVAQAPPSERSSPGAGSSGTGGGGDGVEQAPKEQEARQLVESVHREVEAVAAVSGLQCTSVSCYAPT